MDSLDLLVLAFASLAAFALAVLTAAGAIHLCHWLIGPKMRGYMGGVLLLAASWAAAGAELTGPKPTVSFNRAIRPILSDNCFKCHGPDKGQRKAGLRLDLRAGAVGELRSGGFAVVPGRRVSSELWKRITAGDETELMPPPSIDKHLTRAQINLLGKWIDEGAGWDEHWAYTPPRRPGLPPVSHHSWPRNPIDHFVLQRLEKEGLAPSPEADRATLLRRVTFDLTGLPPTPAEIDAFVADASPNAYERAVDRLLGSPHYGERMAQLWLDLARYADTNGYRLDNHRDVWKWREWVIDALNRNKPYDDFTVEQLAGDLLPHATRDQKIATGFHRNTMVNFGNGSDPKEYLHKAVADRVATTATVWLGSTLACAQCHDHKYDPFTQKDYYRLYAFFNNVAEKGLDGERANPVPSLMVPTAEQARKLAALRRSRQSLGTGHPDIERLNKAQEELAADVPTTLVMRELARPRETHVLIRGDYLSKGEKVTPGVPACLPPLPEGAPANRLGLARWLVDARHPLTARVAANRAWQTFFGSGLVKTADDFGSQGDPPSHPELLDWLAVEFSYGWNVKALHKLIVMSATYRQSSHVGRALRERDPDNRLLARGPRFRLDAEMIRDNALAVSGLLDRRLGGPSVKPHQPAGLWEQVAVGGNYSSQTYVPSEGRDLYRRGLYTYIKRSMPHPFMAAFDAPNREACTVSRQRTTTPLQALVLLNDPAFVEAARALAERVLHKPEVDSAGRLGLAFRLCTGRHPEPRELDILRRVRDAQLQAFRHNCRAARDLVGIGGRPIPANVDVADIAAWTAVASLLLNLDETLTRS